MSHEQNNGTTTLTFRVRPLEPPATDGSCAWLLASISRASDGGLAVNNWPWIFVTLMGTITYHTWRESNSSSKVPLKGDMLVPRRVSICIYSYGDELLPTCRISRIVFFPGSLFTDFHVLVHVTMDLNVCSLDFTSTGASKHPDLSGYFFEKTIWNWRW